MLAPLRERSDDIPLLVSHFLRKYAKGRDVGVMPDALALLRTYRWPGNVRELENVCERIAIFLSGNTVTGAAIPDDIKAARVGAATFAVQLPDEGISLDDVEKAVIVQALERSKWNRTQAARFLRVPRHILLYRMQKFGLTDAPNDSETTGE